MGREVAEVIAYVRATERAVELLDDLPLCMRLLREVHETLLEGGRGHERNPGQTRTSQNWIGPAGCTLSDAAFVPPSIEDMAGCLSELGLIEADPIIDVNLVADRLEIARTTAGNLVNAFLSLEILTQRNDGRQRYRTFLYEDHLSLLR